MFFYLEVSFSFIISLVICHHFMLFLGMLIDVVIIDHLFKLK